jgi:hypothetical protein
LQSEFLKESFYLYPDMGLFSLPGSRGRSKKNNKKDQPDIDSISFEELSGISYQYLYDQQEICKRDNKLLVVVPHLGSVGQLRYIEHH